MVAASPQAWCLECLTNSARTNRARRACPMARTASPPASAPALWPRALPEPRSSPCRPAQGMPDTDEHDREDAAAASVRVRLRPGVGVVRACRSIVVVRGASPRTVAIECSKRRYSSWSVAPFQSVRFAACTRRKPSGSCTASSKAGTSRPFARPSSASSSTCADFSDAADHRTITQRAVSSCSWMDSPKSRPWRSSRSHQTDQPRRVSAFTSSPARRRSSRA